MPIKELIKLELASVVKLMDFTIDNKVALVKNLQHSIKGYIFRTMETNYLKVLKK